MHMLPSYVIILPLISISLLVFSCEAEASKLPPSYHYPLSFFFSSRDSITKDLEEQIALFLEMRNETFRTCLSHHSLKELKYFNFQIQKQRWLLLYFTILQELTLKTAHTHLFRACAFFREPRELRRNEAQQFMDEELGDLMFEADILAEKIKDFKHLYLTDPQKD